MSLAPFSFFQIWSHRTSPHTRQVMLICLAPRDHAACIERLRRHAAPTPGAGNSTPITERTRPAPRSRRVLLLQTSRRCPSADQGHPPATQTIPCVFSLSCSLSLSVRQSTYQSNVRTKAGHPERTSLKILATPTIENDPEELFPSSLGFLVIEIPSGTLHTGAQVDISAALHQVPCGSSGLCIKFPRETRETRRVSSSLLPPMGSQRLSKRVQATT